MRKEVTFDHKVEDLQSRSALSVREWVQKEFPFKCLVNLAVNVSVLLRDRPVLGGSGGPGRTQRPQVDLTCGLERDALGDAPEPSSRGETSPRTSWGPNRPRPLLPKRVVEKQADTIPFYVRDGIPHSPTPPGRPVRTTTRTPRSRRVVPGHPHF